MNVISNAKVLLAPLRFGAGIKGKFIEAMQTGTPTVTTSIGAEAMTLNNSWNGLIANDFEEFAQNAIQLYTDENLWKKSQQTGFEILSIHFVMPSQYTLATLPKPLNPDVGLREIPARTYAVLTYSGMNSETTVQEKIDQLLAWLKAQDISTIGQSQLARYNPPLDPTLPTPERDPAGDQRKLASRESRCKRD